MNKASSSLTDVKMRVYRFLKAYEAINGYLASRQCNPEPLTSLSLRLDEDDLNFIHQVRILYKKQGNPDKSTPLHYRILAARYALLVAMPGLNPPLHQYEKKLVGRKVEIYEIVDGITGTEKRPKGSVDSEAIADWWIEENQNAIHDRYIRAGVLPNPVVKITSFAGDKVSLAFRRVSKGTYAKYGWYEVRNILINIRKFIARATAAGFSRKLHGDGILHYTKWEEVLEPEKIGGGGQERNPKLDPPRPGWRGQSRPKRKAGHSGRISPGPRTTDYSGLSSYSADELKNLTHYNDIVCQKVQKDTTGEKELLAFIREQYQGEVLERENGSDIYLPDPKIGFDYHEMLWHLETVVGTKYHWKKANNASRQGVRLIQVFEDEWLNRTDIVKSRIRCILGKATRIFARKTNIVTLSQDESAAFLERTHLQGNYNCTVAYGLEHDGRLVACMTFGVSRFNKRCNCELLRYSSELGTVVVGGADKLLQQFFREGGNVDLISYADRRWSNGNLYHQLRFKLDGISEPSYSYYNICKKQLLSRIKITKNKLTGMFGYEDRLNVHDIMLMNGFDRIWDAGQYRFSIPKP